MVIFLPYVQCCAENMMSDRERADKLEREKRELTETFERKKRELERELEVSNTPHWHTKSLIRSPILFLSPFLLHTHTSTQSHLCSQSIAPTYPHTQVLTDSLPSSPSPPLSEEDTGIGENSG